MAPVKDTVKDSSLTDLVRYPPRISLPLLVGLVLPPRPEEAAQAVALPARHDVDVEVRHALRDLGVDRGEAPVRPEAFLHGAGDALDGGEERWDERGGKREQVGRVLPGHDQDVALEDGPRIEEGADGVLAKDEGGGDLAADYGAEGAGGHRAHLSMRAAPRRERQQIHEVACGFPSSRPGRV